MLPFKDFCNNTAVVKNKLSVDKTETIDDPKLDKFIENIKNTLNDNVELSYIQRVFSSTGTIIEKVSAKYPDGEIPNGLINKISQGLYEKPYAELDDSKCKIINVLSIYYSISN